MLKKLNLKSRTKDDQQKLNGNILLVTGMAYKNMHRISLTPQLCVPAEYLDWIYRFLNSFFNKSEITLEWRSYKARMDINDNHVQSILRKLTGGFRNNLLIRNFGSIYDMLKNSRLIVCDHCGTTILESMSSNIPTVMFWDPVWQEVRDESKNFIQLLKNAGIYHETPESAAEFIAAIDKDITSWWWKKDVQAAKNEFVYQYARSANYKEIIDQYLNLLMARKLTKRLKTPVVLIFFIRETVFMVLDEIRTYKPLNYFLFLTEEGLKKNMNNA